jgi:hypothetical protein
MNDIRDELKRLIERDGHYDDKHVVRVDEVIDAVNNFKPNKGDGSMTGLSTDNFIYACDELFVHVARLLNIVSLFTALYPTISSRSGQLFLFRRIKTLMSQDLTIIAASLI